MQDALAAAGVWSAACSLPCGSALAPALTAAAAALMPAALLHLTHSAATLNMDADNPGCWLVLVNAQHLRRVGNHSTYPTDERAHTTVAFGLRPAADGPREIAVRLPEVRGCAQMQCCCALRRNTHCPHVHEPGWHPDYTGLRTQLIPTAAHIVF